MFAFANTVAARADRSPEPPRLYFIACVAHNFQQPAYAHHQVMQERSQRLKDPPGRRKLNGGLGVAASRTDRRRRRGPGSRPAGQDLRIP